MKYYIGTFLCDSNCITHYGIKGQQHGVRRYQREDGTLTPLGKIHYRVTISVGRRGSNNLDMVSNGKPSHASYASSGYASRYTGASPGDKGTANQHRNGYYGHTHTHLTGSFAKKQTPTEANITRVKKVIDHVNKSQVKSLIEDQVRRTVEDIKNIPNEFASAIEDSKKERAELEKTQVETDAASEKIKSRTLGNSMEKVLDKKQKRLDDTYSRLYAKYAKEYKPTFFEYLATNPATIRLIQHRNISKQVENDPEYKKAKNDYDKFKKMHDNQVAKRNEVWKRNEETRKNNNM